jgi:hypothetical protein
MLVTAVTSGFRILVESSRPPRPVSTTATSIFCSAKYLNAIAVITSKNVGIGFARITIGSTNRTSRAKSECGIIVPFTQIRSRISTRWGLVYRPTL